MGEAQGSGGSFSLRLFAMKQGLMHMCLSFMSLPAADYRHLWMLQRMSVPELVAACAGVYAYICLNMYALCTHLRRSLCPSAAELSSSCRWILILPPLTVAAADEAPSHIIPHDYKQMLMAANGCKCACHKCRLNSHLALLANGYPNIRLPGHV